MEPMCQDCTIPLICDEARLCEMCRRVEEKLGPRVPRAVSAAKAVVERILR
jgi:hypothetical protein